MRRSERAKYERMYETPGYRAGGHSHAAFFVRNLAKQPCRVIDFGCGAGETSAWLIGQGYDVQACDIAANCLLPGPAQLLGNRFHVCFLDELPWEIEPADWGICLDVMEHLPDEWIGPSLRAIRSKVPACFFVISGVIDSWGDRIGERLHLSIRPRPWWEAIISEHWREVLSVNGSNNTFAIVGR